MLHARLISPLEKVFLSGGAPPAPFAGCSALRGERVSWQLLYTKDTPGRTPLSVAVSAPWDIAVYKVGHVPVELAAYPSSHDEDYLSVAPGLYPDVLYPAVPAQLHAVHGLTQTLWFSVTVAQNAPAGPCPVSVTVTSQEGDEVRLSCTITVMDAALPPAKLHFTQWFHSDCIADYYGVPVFSEDYWTRTEQFVAAAVHSGVTMLLTPLFTPPLDTAIGGERPTVQLVEVLWDEKEGYRFDFSRLRRWADMAFRQGIQTLEMSHLFTQWGAGFAPKILVQTPAGAQKRFGWHTEATSPEYAEFLRCFLPALTDFLRQEGLEGKVYFHISDEPSPHHLESYRAAKALVAPYLEGFPVIDALSNFAFYETGLVPCPVPATNHIAPFLEAGVPNLWTYYCCSQGAHVSNRFMAMPSARNRILGAQLYRFAIAGFLHWGFNFYYSGHSQYAVNPFCVTDAGGAFPAGDAFSVYPGPEGPLLSIRSEVFYAGLQDLRAMQLLERLAGRGAVLDILERFGVCGFDRYPKGAHAVLALREEINGRIADLCADSC